MRQRLLLVGGGHSHALVLLSVVRRQINFADYCDVVLVSDGDKAFYSGCVV